MTTPIPQIPTAPDQERAVLGAILMDRDAIIAVASWLKADDFYLETNRVIYQAAMACYAKKTPPDLQTIAAELERVGKLQSIGGMSFLFGLTEACSTAYHVEYYALAVKETSDLRSLIDVGGRIAALGFERDRDVADVQNDAEMLLRAAVSRETGRGGLVPIFQVIDESLDRFQKGGIVGIPTGFIDLDRLTGGLIPTDFDVIAARPGVGKSALAGNIAYNVARRGLVDIKTKDVSGQAVLFYSLEMGRDQVLARLASSMTGIPPRDILLGNLGQDDLVVVMSAYSQIAAMPILIDDRAGSHINEIKRTAIQYTHRNSQNPPPVIIVDYLQLVKSSHKDRLQEVSYVARELKNLAKDLNTTVIALSQLSRAVEGRPSKVPTLADLRESGEIEQAANNVWMLYREEMYDKDTDKKGVAELHIVKQRNGALGVVNLFYDGKATRFRDLAPYQSPEGY